MQTPNELGFEQTQRVMNCIPETGVVEAYSQIPLKLRCKPRVTLREEYWTKNYSMVKNYSKNREETDQIFKYSCFFDIEGRDEEEPIFLHLQARGICPTIKISHTALDFGDCSVNEKRDFMLTIENQHESLPVSLAFPKVLIYNLT